MAKAYKQDSAYIAHKKLIRTQRLKTGALFAIRSVLLPIFILAIVLAFVKTMTYGKVKEAHKTSKGKLTDLKQGKKVIVLTAKTDKKKDVKSAVKEIKELQQEQKLISDDVIDVLELPQVIEVANE